MRSACLQILKLKLATPQPAGYQGCFQQRFHFLPVGQNESFVIAGRFFGLKHPYALIAVSVK